MTLSRKYEEIMDRVKVTEDMKDREINNILESGATGGNRKSHNGWGRYIVLAACIIVTVAVVRFIPSVVNRNDLTSTSTEAESTETDTMTAVDMAIPDIKEFNSADELKGELGFDVSDVAGIPFDIIDTEYYCYWGYMAEIDYVGNSDRAIYRKAKETNDISGDYNEYAETDVMDIDGVEVALKGNDGLYNLAIWQNGDYSYSLYIDKGVDYNTFAGIIKNIH